ncbi:MAG: hypothetical protein Q9183_005734 [Haloplaca sp. 2 TL-2023]
MDQPPQNLAEAEAQLSHHKDNITRLSTQLDFSKKAVKYLNQLIAEHKELDNDANAFVAKKTKHAKTKMDFEAFLRASKGSDGLAAQPGMKVEGRDSVLPQKRDWEDDHGDVFVTVEPQQDSATRALERVGRMALARYQQAQDDTTPTEEPRIHRPTRARAPSRSSDPLPGTIGSFMQKSAGTFTAADPIDESMWDWTSESQASSPDSASTSFTLPATGLRGEAYAREEAVGEWDQASQGRGHYWTIDGGVHEG